MIDSAAASAGTVANARVPVTRIRQRRVNLVDQEPHPVPLRHLSDRGQLVRREHHAGRVVRVAQQQHLDPFGGQVAIERVEVVPVLTGGLTAQRRLDDSASGGRNHDEERRVHRSIDDHACTRAS